MLLKKLFQETNFIFKVNSIQVNKDEMDKQMEENDYDSTMLFSRNRLRIVVHIE